MRDSVDTLGGLLSAIIASAWAAAPDKCLHLIRKFWAISPSQDKLTFQTLLTKPSWDSASVDIICEIVERTQIQRYLVLNLAKRIAESDTSRALSVVAHCLRGDLTRTEHSYRINHPHIGEREDIDTQDQIESERFRHIQDELRNLVGDASGWYGLEELAVQEPKAFLREVWPLLVRLLEWFGATSGKYYTGFREENLMMFKQLGVPADQATQHHAYPFPSSFDMAVGTLAKTDFAAFHAFALKEGSHDSETIQRLLIRGFAAAGSTAATNAVDFLLSDPRRFHLGTFADEFGDTLLLIRSIAPHLTTESSTRLQQAILSWKRRTAASEEQGEWIDAIERYNRRDRLRLLHALPPEQFSQQTREVANCDSLEFPDFRKSGIHRIEGGYIGSPVSATQMTEVDDQDIVTLFEQLCDNTGWDHPLESLQGGSIQASREFRNFAKDHPIRTLKIISQFKPGQQERPAGEALLGLSESNFPSDQLFELVVDLDSRGFTGEDYRTNAAEAMSCRTRENVGLPDTMTRLLERWLESEWAEHPASLPDAPEIPPPTPVSVLWNSSGYGIPHGIYNVMKALSYGYLMRNPPAVGEWLAAMRAQLRRTKSAGPWQCLIEQLRHLRLCPPRDAVEFLRELFERHPDLLASWPGVFLLTRVWSFCPENDVWIWLDRIRKSAWPSGRQAYGELIALRAHHAPSDARVREELSTLLSPALRDAKDCDDERVGLALAAAYLWDEPTSTRLATEILVGLIPRAKDRLARAILLVFQTADRMGAGME
ncbi:MAG: hypothetical protein WCN98_14390, partial [Verrucomicrobiaceae bacterium]